MGQLRLDGQPSHKRHFWARDCGSDRARRFWLQGFDYRGETGPTGWPAISSHYGIFDLAGFPKVGANYYRAWWRDLTAGTVSVDVSPDDWTAPVAVGAPIEIRVTTTAPSAAVFVNGVEQPRQKMPRFGSLKWTVPFARGNLTAVAYNEAGDAVATKTVVSAGKASRLHATIADPYTGRNASRIAADGQDVALVTVALLDSDGVLVPNADVEVTLSVDGPGKVIGTTSGDPADHSLDSSASCSTFHGLLRGIVASSELGAKGAVTVRATAAGVEAGVVVVEAG